jgi:acyl carrier protein
VNQDRILEIVLATMRSANLGRTEQQQLEVSPTAPLFGAPSPLDSLGLVALLMDIEEAFAVEGTPIILSDERAMSQRNSPFRDVPSLVRYIATLAGQGA